jgi:hypothetical protein
MQEAVPAPATRGPARKPGSSRLLARAVGIALRGVPPEHPEADRLVKRFFCGGLRQSLADELACSFDSSKSSTAQDDVGRSRLHQVVVSSAAVQKNQTA